MTGTDGRVGFVRLVWREGEFALRPPQGAAHPDLPFLEECWDLVPTMTADSARATMRVDAEFDRWAAPRDLVVWRGMLSSDFADWVCETEAGAELCDPGFLSGVFNRGTVLSLLGDVNGRILFRIRVRAGSPAVPLGMIARDQAGSVRGEVLFPRGSRIVVRDAVHQSGITRVDAHLLEPSRTVVRVPRTCRQPRRARA